MHSCSGTGTPEEAWQRPHTHSLGMKRDECQLDIWCGDLLMLGGVLCVRIVV